MAGGVNRKTVPDRDVNQADGVTTGYESDLWRMANAFRNLGAAFGMFATTNSAFRLIFFVATFISFPSRRRKQIP